MKVYSSKTYSKLGFDEILAYVDKNLISDEAKTRWEQTAPIFEKDLIETSLKRTDEYKQLLLLGEKLPSLHFTSLGSLLSKVKVRGNWLRVDELLKLLKWMRSLYEIRRFFQQRKENLPALDELVHVADFDPSLIARIELLIDNRGNLRDDASPALLQIRKSQQSTANELRDVLNKILRNAIDNNWSQDKEVTIRNDRFVIPIKAESKGHVPGFVQDISQSGGTLFVEPTAALALNNKLKELQLAEKNEILNILQGVTEEVGGHLEMLDTFREVMIELELVRGKAYLARDLDAILPIIEVDAEAFCLRKAYYPLLLLKAKKDNEQQVIPLDIDFNAKSRIVVISGPNAGGKSVSLKTLGLLQLMLQSGMLVPAGEGSVFRLFDSLFINIGDEQSVASDLSTYTSHLFHLRQMGDNMNENALFLIDEFGSGTDPKQGGAIAEAFLERFVRQKAYGVITTHYGNIKKFAELNSGINNAAMEFDTDELKPTYKLLTGVPGRSYAFEIAERVGVHPSIIRKARKKVGKEEVDVEKLLEELERKNTRYKQLVAENRNKSQKLERLVKENEKLQQELVRKRKKVVNEAKEEANRLIMDANRKIENTIREIKEHQAEKALTKRLRQSLQDETYTVEPETVDKSEQPTEKIKELNGKIEEGDWVKLKHAETQGKLIELKGNRGVVESGEVKLTVKLDQLVKIHPPKKGKSQHVTVSGLRMVDAQMELRVMGMRVEEAILEVDKKIDKALLAGLRKIKILHGKGSGILRNAIRNHLKSLPFVTAYYDAAEEEGGAGWTICELG